MDKLFGEIEYTREDLDGQIEENTCVEQKIGTYNMVCYVLPIVLAAVVVVHKIWKDCKKYTKQLVVCVYHNPFEII